MHTKAQNATREIAEDREIQGCTKKTNEIWTSRKKQLGKIE